MIDWTWADPGWLWLLALLPFLIGLSIWRILRVRQSRITYSDTSSLRNLPGNWRRHGIWITHFLGWLAFALIVAALARPRFENTTVERSAEGIDIVITLDISSSMRAEDLKPNRFKAARRVVKDFIDKRVSDRIGLVAFARKSFTVVPPTLDYDLIKQMLNNLEIGMIKDGTAIGMGIASAVNRLRESKAKSKVIILLTDGENNAGKIDPVTAAEMAATYGIKIYTIGVGTHGMAPYPVRDPVFGKRYQNIKVDINEKMLRKIAEMTGGAYFRATDTQQLRKIYERIDQLEKTKIEEIIYTDYKELYPRFLLPGVVFLLLAVLSEKVFFRTGI